MNLDAPLRLLPALLISLLALPLGGCCCGEPQGGLQVLARATAPTTRHIAVVVTRLDEKSDEGRAQALVEAMVVAAPPGMNIESCMASSMQASAVAIQDEVHNARILQLPSVVTLIGDEATIQVSDTAAEGKDEQSLRLTVLAALPSGDMTIEFSYEAIRDGTSIYSLPPTRIDVGEGHPVVVTVKRR